MIMLISNSITIPANITTYISESNSVFLPSLCATGIPGTITWPGFVITSIESLSVGVVGVVGVVLQSCSLKYNDFSDVTVLDVLLGYAFTSTM